MPTTIEIVDPPPLATGEIKLLDLHSALNALHAVYGEVYMISHTHPSISGTLESYCEAITGICDQLEGDFAPFAFLHEIARVADQLEQVLPEVESKIARDGAPNGRSTAALRRILGVVRVRLAELFERKANGQVWREEPIDTFLSNFTAVFEAIREHSGGRFGITFDRREHGNDDYLIEVRIEGCPPETLFIPPEFPDIVRDLSANARKYTAPGGTISVHIDQNSDRLAVSIKDTGIGIPSAEIPKVVQFGQRASNVGDIRTLGGGFGLTKAVTLVKSWGGRFWISSEASEGTEIRFEIPAPNAQRSA